MAKTKPAAKKSPRRIVVVGAALAGPTAAARAREMDETAEIILLERNTRVSYAMSALALHLSNEVQDIEDLNREREDFFRQVYNIDVRTRTEVEEIRRKKKEIHISTAGNRSVISYDKLVFATGASSIAPIGIKDAANFAYFRTIDDLARIKQALEGGARHFVVLGGGSMGAEALDGLVRAGATVTMIERKQRVLPDYSEEIVTPVY